MSAASAAAPVPDAPSTPRPVPPPTTAPAAPPPSPLAAARLLYVSYFFAAWGDRMWEFAAVIFLLEIFPNTLLPSSIFGFCEALCGISAGPRVGKLIDGWDRLRAVRTSVVVQNSIVYVGMVLFNYALSNVQTLDRSVQLFIFCIVVLCGMVAKVGSMLNKIAIHKDWVVVLAKGSKPMQTAINASMRRVDLTCSILAPLAVGVLSSTLGPAQTCVCVAAWSLVSMAVEWRVNHWVYAQIPDLRIPKKPKAPIVVVECGGTSAQGGSNTPSLLAEHVTVLRAYVQHPAFRVSLPYCLLYTSVLSFGGIMVSYLRTVGCSDALLGFGRGAGALVAILATVAVPKMVHSMGLVKTGVVTNAVQIVALAPLVYAFLALSPDDASSRTAIIVLVFIAICCSRFGLWGFDLAQTQLMQELVLPQDAGKVNGAQDSLMNFCWLLSFVFTMVFSNPRDFKYPALFSFLAVLLCGVLFNRYAHSVGFKDPPRAGSAPVPAAAAPAAASVVVAAAAAVLPPAAAAAAAGAAPAVPPASPHPPQASS